MSFADSPNRAPDASSSIERIIEHHLAELHTAMPGIVQKYDASKQLADVQPVFQRLFLDDEDAPQTYELPVITDVPVAFPQGGGAYLTFPLAKGDRVLLVFSQRSLDAWKESDGKTQMLPGETRRHHLSDAVALAGIATARNPIPNASSKDVVLGAASGQKVMLGTPTAAQALALAQQCDARLSALESAAGSHTHSNGNNGSPTGTVIGGFSPGGGGTTTASTRTFTDA